MALKDNGWIGVDLDGTLAHYTEWTGAESIGEPVPLMVARVKNMMTLGFNVRLLTARVSSNGSAARDLEAARFRVAANDWMINALGVALPVTNEKDFAMIELWDDRAVQVIGNSGTPVEGARSRIFDLKVERDLMRR